jgi:hypothetical protein
MGGLILEMLAINVRSFLAPTAGQGGVGHNLLWPWFPGFQPQLAEEGLCRNERVRQLCYLQVSLLPLSQ